MILLISGSLALLVAVVAWFCHIRFCRFINRASATVETPLIDATHWTAYTRREKRRKLLAFRNQTHDADLSRHAKLALLFELVSLVAFLLGMSLYLLSVALL